MHLLITSIARTTPHATYLFFTKRAGYNQGGNPARYIKWKRGCVRGN